MSVAGWLAIREARVRRARAVVAIVLVAVGVALGTGLELLARAREAAAALRVDGMGPALRVVPASVGGSALARLELGEARLPDWSAKVVRETLGSDLRAVRQRLVLTRIVAGRPTPVIGSDPAQGESAVVGPVLVERLGGAGTIALGGASFAVRGLAEATGTVEDAAIHVTLEEAERLAGAQGPNELQLYLRAGVSPAAAQARLEAAGIGGRVVPGARGEVADEGIQGALARGRGVAQAVLALVVSLGLAVAAHLDASERRVEAATLKAIGALPGLIVRALLLRSLAIGAAGGLLGVALGAAVTAGMTGGGAADLLAAWGVTAGVPLAASALGALAASPAALTLALGDPVEALQE